MARRRDDLRSRVLRAARSRPDATVAEIARQAGCSPSTVRRHMPRRLRRGAALPAAADAVLPPGYLRRVLARTAAADGPQRHRRLQAAKHPATPLWMAARLAADPDPYVRAGVAGRDDCPVLLLRRLASDPDPTPRAAAAARPPLPVPDIVRLAGSDPEAQVRAGAAHNPNCPPGLLAELAATHGAGIDVDDPEAWMIAAAAVENPNCPSSVLAHAVSSPVDGVRAAAATRTDCPLRTLERLAADPCPNVAMEVARNPAAPQELIESLAGHPAPSVQAAVAGRDDCPPELLRRLYAFEAPESSMEWDVLETVLARREDCPPQQLERFAARQDPILLRAIVAAHRNTPGRVLRRLAGDRSGIVRAAAAGNPRCPRECLIALAADDAANTELALNPAAWARAAI